MSSLDCLAGVANGRLARRGLAMAGATALALGLATVVAATPASAAGCRSEIGVDSSRAQIDNCASNGSTPWAWVYNGQGNGFGGHPLIGWANLRVVFADGTVEEFDTDTGRGSTFSKLFPGKPRIIAAELCEEGRWGIPPINPLKQCGGLKGVG
ncbi:hypothetical protein [Kutzneria sp. NPDC051319]|uniref:hypothetical protein n=1 Tax=Kutzneria sp. NPDC051319 TaxID=3155047 RepID=UPI0034391597